MHCKAKGASNNNNNSILMDCQLLYVLLLIEK